MPNGISSKPRKSTLGSSTYIIRPRYVFPVWVTEEIINKNTIIEKVIIAIVAPISEIQFFDESGSFSFILFPGYSPIEIKK
jgi:hypothetical protein